MVSRLATVLLVIASAWVSVHLDSIASGWQVVMEVGAGTGAVYLLRWYWWRINAWSEISAMACSLAVTVTLNALHPFQGNGPVLFAKTALTTTVITTLVWLTVTLLTPAEPPATLEAFYRLVRPDVRGWQPIAAQIESDFAARKTSGAPPSAARPLRLRLEGRELQPGDEPTSGSDEPIPPTRDLGRNLTAWLLGCAMVYLCLFGTGKLLLHQPALGVTLLALSAVAAIALYRTFVTSFNQEPDVSANAAAVERL